MTINLTGRQVDLDDALREYVEKKVQKLEQHGARLQDVHVTLSMAKSDAVTEVSVIIDRNPIVAKDHANDFFQSIDGVIAKIERQVMRLRGKRVGSKVRHGAPSKNDVVLVDGSRLYSKYDDVARRKVSVPSMGLEDAMDAMKQSTEDNCVVFADRQTGMVRIVHRRQDGEMELIELVL